MKRLKAFVKQTLKKTPYFYPLRRVYRKIRGFIIKDQIYDFPIMPYMFTHDDAKRVYDVVLTGRLQHGVGTQVAALEKEFAAYHKTKYALATNAGTSALELAVKAIGILPGDEVIVPAYTFVATAQAVLSHGGIPVFADIDDTFTLSPASAEKMITKRTKAIMPVHLFGNVADMDRILAVARKHKLLVIEDACQSLGASYKGRKVGSMGDIGCFSFNEAKSIYTGQGGMLITSQKKYFDIANMTRNTGQISEELGSDIVTSGNTFALTEMQAALARSILRQLDDLVLRRKQNYEMFVDMIDSKLLHLRWYRILPEADAAFNRLVFMINFDAIRTTRRSFIRAANERGVPLKEIYPMPLYTYSYFREKRDLMTGNTYPFDLSPIKYRSMKLPFAELFARQQVGMEFSPYLTPDHIRRLCTVLRDQMIAYT